MVYTIEEITNRLMPVFEQNGVTKAILFGSYAKGTATEESDIDIVVDTEPEIKGLRFVEVIDKVFIALEKDVDLIQRKCIRPNGKTDVEVANTGVVIYERTGYQVN
jgi:predicted nucleotidyltransferase